MESANQDNAAEKAVDVAAAAVLAAAVGFGAGATGLGAVPTIAAAVAASVAGFAFLRNVSAGDRAYNLPGFELLPLEFAAEAEELLLQDELGTLPPDSRIIRLFDPGREEGALKRPAPQDPDAAQALTEALAELRRSLR